MVDLVEEIKTRLGITGSYHDALISAYAEDVKAFMSSGGVPQTVIDSDTSVGCIARGVADLWNYGSGDGKFSEVFFQRVIQLATPSASSGEGSCHCPTLDDLTESEIDQCMENITLD